MEVTVLVVSPHPDDAEIGVGGTILSLRDRGVSVGVVDLTNGEPTPMGTPEKREKEWKEASKILNLSWRGCLYLPNRYLFDSKENRIKLAEVIRKLKPKVLFAPYFVDAHPDHIACSRIVEGARFYAKFTKTDMEGEPHYPRWLFYYLASHLRLHFQPSYLVDISPYFSQKMKAIFAYKSQFGYGDREKFLADYLESTNGYFGRLMGVRYAEPFFSHEPVGIRDLKAFLEL
jgi:bacillithiol biosynthesis deacetylase BshB1